MRIIDVIEDDDVLLHARIERDVLHQIVHAPATHTDENEAVRNETAVA